LVDKGQGNPVQGNVGRLARALVETAEAGCLLADDASVRLASVHFRWREVALPDLPAFGKGLRAHEAVAATEAGKGFQATDAHRSPLVGRDEALDRLERGWARVRAGRTAAFVVAGEPGIGKSRLVHELTERIGGEAEIHRHDCMPQYANVPFRPLTAVIEDSLGIAPSASTEDRARAATAAAASQSDPAAAVALRLLLGLPVPPHAVPPSVLQQSMRRIVLDLIRRKARRRPLVLTIEDIHWCDQPTLRILADLSLPGTDAAVLVLASVRPGDAENSIPAAERIVLAPLDPKDAARLAEAVLEDATVPEAVVDAIVRRAAGVPLFVEELALASRGGEPVIPGNIKELMLARLDRIPSGKAAAVLGATIGNAFPLELLRQAAAHLGNPDDVVRGLGALVEGGILESGRDDSRTIYRFRHGLLQEAIYDAQPRRDRRRRHNAVVSVLEAGSLKGWTAHQPAVLAWHLQGAGREAEALTWWIAAAEDAVAKGAHVDALGHGMRGLVVLEGLAEDPATLAAEIRLRLTMAAAAASSLGLGNRQSEAHYARALLLVRRLPASLPSFSVLWGHYTVTSLRWRWIEATEAASHLLAAADALKDDRAVGMANFAAGHAAFFTGRMVAARPHLARAAAAPEDSVRTLPFDYRPYALALQASADWLLGTDDDPAEMCDRALAMAARGRPIDLGPPLTTTAYLQFLRGDYGAVATLNDRLVDLCDKGGLVMWKALALLNRALLAGSEAGLADVDQALALWDAAEAGPPTPTPLLLAAAARLRAGRWEEAAATAEEVLTQAEATGGLWFRPKALTMLGDALRALGRREDACGAYGRAVEEARAMGLVQFEREAATLLSSL
ncbi:MAG: ATP-binding protein, partial [Actinomycetota bacterium]